MLNENVFLLIKYYKKKKTTIQSLVIKNNKYYYVKIFVFEIFIYICHVDRIAVIKACKIQLLDLCKDTTFSCTLLHVL